MMQAERNAKTAFMSDFNALVQHKHAYESTNDACFEIEAAFPPRGKYAALFIRFLKVPAWKDGRRMYPATVDPSSPHTCMVNYGRANCSNGWLYPGKEVAPAPSRIRVLQIESWFPGHSHNAVVTAEYNTRKRAFEIHAETTPFYPIIQSAPSAFGKAEFRLLHRHLSGGEWKEARQTSTLDICGSGRKRGMRMTCKSAKAYSAFMKIANRATCVDAFVDRLMKLEGDIEWQNNERGAVPSNEWYSLFRLKTKTEVQHIDITRAQICGFVRSYKTHTYRLKKRYIFSDARFEISLTMVKESSGTSFPDTVTMYDILKGVLSCDEKYELEIEYAATKDQHTRRSGEMLVGWIDRCVGAMVGEGDATVGAHELADVLRAHNRLLLKREDAPNDFLVRSMHAPSVVSLTPTRLEKLDCRRYTLLSKTDGERSIGLVYTSCLYLFPSNTRILKYSMPHWDASYRIVLDGEVYKDDAGTVYYYIFDVYASSVCPSVVDKPLIERLDSVRELDTCQAAGAACSAIHVQTKRCSTVERGIDDCAVGTLQPRTDGLIVMYAGPLSRVASSDTQRSIVALKWKPAVDCTIDFKLSYMPTKGSAFAEVELLSLFTSQSHLSLTALLAGNRYELPAMRSLVPFVTTDTAYPLRCEAVVRLPCNESGLIVEGSGEGRTIYPGDIAELSYREGGDGWCVVRKRADKTMPNALSVAIDNWELAHMPTFEPPAAPTPELLGRYCTPTGSACTAPPSAEADPYYKAGQARKHCRLTAHHNCIKRQSVLWAADEASKATLAPLDMLELGCGRGTELVTCVLPQLSDRLASYVGVDIDEDGLLRPYDGAYWRYHSYLRGEGGKGPAGKRPSVLFLQGDCSREAGGDGGEDADADGLAAWTDSAKQKMAYATLPSGAQFDVLSVQFAMHYMYRSPAFWRNVCRLLKPDGLLVATVPNGDFLRAKVEEGAGTYEVHTADDFAFTYAASERCATDEVLFSSTKIHAQPEPLFFRRACEAVVAETCGALLSCEIVPFADQAALPFRVPDGQSEGCELTAAEDEYSAHGHYVVVVRRNT
jgi:SAM-dependent methyltransferase